MNTRMKRCQRLKLVAVEAENSVVRETGTEPLKDVTAMTDQTPPEQSRENLGGRVRRSNK